VHTWHCREHLQHAYVCHECTIQTVPTEERETEKDQEKDEEKDEEKERDCGRARKREGEGARWVGRVWWGWRYRSRAHSGESVQDFHS